MTNRDKTVTSSVAEMSEIVRAAAEPWAPGDSVKAGMNRAGRRLGFAPRRVSTFWYARPAAILADEMDRARAWYAEHTKKKPNASNAARLSCALVAKQRGNVSMKLIWGWLAWAAFAVADRAYRVGEWARHRQMPGR